mgnify:CR=1 FL=1
MPKQKTNKSASKRLKKTASGKIKYTRANKGHLMTGKSRKRKRTIRKGGILSDAERRRLSVLI